MTEAANPIPSDQPTEQDPSSHNNSQHRYRVIGMEILTILFLVIGIVWFLHWVIWGRFQVYTDDAYVNGNMVQLMSQVAGTVIEITAENTQLVAPGQVIIKIDPADMTIAMQHAQASLAETVRQV